VFFHLLETGASGRPFLADSRTDERTDGTAGARRLSTDQSTHSTTDRRADGGVTSATQRAFEANGTHTELLDFETDKCTRRSELVTGDTSTFDQRGGRESR
jgi:hypothetical protein